MKTLLRILLVLAAVAVPTSSAAADSLASQIIKRAEMNRGVCAVLGIEGDFPVELVRASELLVHVRDEAAPAVYGLRRHADKQGIGIDRLIAEVGSRKALPYADNSIDLIVVPRPVKDAAEISIAEVIRALRPEGTVFIRVAKRSGPFVRSTVERYIVKKKPFEWQSTDGSQWVVFQKPPMKGAADWSHWEKSADNNPVSNDQVIKAPYMTQFMADPLYIGMPSVTTAAAGRTFLAIGHIAHHEREWEGLLRLIARNGYNGQILWERKLPDGYYVHRSAFIATRDIFYMINGDHCLLLDSKTGAEKGALRLKEFPGHWKWMAIHEGRLYALIGKPDPKAQVMNGDRSFGGWSWGDLSSEYYEKRVPGGFGDTLVCFDLKQKQVSWSHKEESGVLIDSRGIAIHENRVFIYCPDHYLKSLAADTGSFRWVNDDKQVLGLIERQGKGLISTPGWRTQCLMVASPDALAIQGQTRMNVVGIATADGKFLWKKDKVTNNPNAIFVDGKFILGVGERGSHVVIDPVTGTEEENLGFFKRACTRLTASTDSLFCRGEGTLRFDRETKKVLVDGTARPGCNDGALPANGMLYLGPWQCDCNLSIIGHLARTSAGDFRFDHSAKESNRLERSADFESVKTVPASGKEWVTFRGDNRRSGSTSVRVTLPNTQKWNYQPLRPYVPSTPTAAGDLVFMAGEDGKVRAIDASSGKLKWDYLTPAPSGVSSEWHVRLRRVGDAYE